MRRPLVISDMTKGKAVSKLRPMSKGSASPSVQKSSFMEMQSYALSFSICYTGAKCLQSNTKEACWS